MLIWLIKTGSNKLKSNESLVTKPSSSARGFLNIFNKYIKKIDRPIEIYTFLQTRISFWDMTYFGLFPWLLVWSITKCNKPLTQEHIKLLGQIACQACFLEDWIKRPFFANMFAALACGAADTKLDFKSKLLDRKILQENVNETEQRWI